MSKLSILVAVIGIFLLAAFFEILFLVPSEKRKKKKKKEAPQNPQQRDWRETALRLEKLVHSLKQDLARAEIRETDYEKKLAVEKLRAKKFKDKINQEKEWQKREEQDSRKKKQEYHRLQTDLAKTLENYSKEHAQNIRLTHELKDLKQERDTLSGQKRKAEVENLQLKEKGDQNRQEIAQLKKEVIDLQKKKDDMSWIAKTEYEKLERQIKEKDVEIERLRREKYGES